jgi:hypothetical protein
MYINFTNDRQSLSFSRKNNLDRSDSKTRKVFTIVLFGIIILLSRPKEVDAIGPSMPVSPTRIERVIPSRYDGSTIKIAKTGPKARNRVSFRSPKEIFYMICLADPKLASNYQVLELIKELRGGSWEMSVIATTALVGFIILIFRVHGFVNLNPVDPGWGLPANNRFQPPNITGTSHPSFYDIFFRGTSSANRGSAIMAEANQQPQSQRSQLTQVSTHVVPKETQVASLKKNGIVDIKRCFAEVERRAAGRDGRYIHRCKTYRLWERCLWSRFLSCWKR